MPTFTECESNLRTETGNLAKFMKSDEKTPLKVNQVLAPLKANASLELPTQMTVGFVLHRHFPIFECVSNQTLET